MYLFATVTTGEIPDLSFNMNGNISLLVWDARTLPAVPTNKAQVQLIS